MEGLLHRKLLRARLEQGLTLRTAAKKTGVSKETISELERGKRSPHPPTLYKIAQGYGIPVGELLQEEEPPVPLAM
jgi:XRE family transcriptional regulator, regulator of sulfur utilization